MRNNQPSQHTLLRLSSVLFALTVFLVIFFSFRFGWTGPFTYDDAPSLAGLEHFHTTGDWIAWVTSGAAGPGGRGIALASFLIDGLNWPHSAAPFLRTNTLLHLANGLLAALVFMRLAQYSTHLRIALPVGVISAAAWTALPILISAVLMPVQRMVLLAAAFMLLGVYLYLIGRSLINSRPIVGTVLISAGIAGGTTLGFLSKENAATLPLLILVCEFTILRHDRPGTRLWRALFFLFVVAPSAALFFFLLSRGFASSFGHREFTLTDRLFTQAVVLWDYLRLTALPQPHAFSPFQDSQRIFGPPLHDLATAFALSAWVIVIAAALFLRTRSPLFSFAVFWFLGGHIIESTVIPLELRFEHRNYFPLLGPVYALVASGFISIKRARMQRVALALSVPYMILILLIHVQTTTLWGDQRISAEIWHSEQPESIRASQNLILRYLDDGQHNAALSILHRALEKSPRATELAIQGVLISCQVSTRQAMASWRDRSLDLVRNGRITDATARNIKILYDLEKGPDCAELVGRDIQIELLSSVLANPDLRVGRDGKAMLHFLLSQAYIEARDLDNVVFHLERSLAYSYNLRILSTGVAVFNSAGMFEQGLELIHDHKPELRGNPVFRIVMDRRAVAGWEALREKQSELVNAEGRTNPQTNLQDTHFP